MSKVFTVNRASLPFDPRQICALRSVRSGIGLHQACRKYRVTSEAVAQLDALFKGVPDRFLSSIEYLLSDNMKLHRLIGALGRTDVPAPQFQQTLAG